MKAKYVDSAGLNYGFSGFNKNVKTGIRYSCIPVICIAEAFYDSSEPVYANVCPLCGEDISPDFLFTDFTCPNCAEMVDENDFDLVEPVSEKIEGEYKAYVDDRGDCILTKSPYYTYAQFASPCFPGGCYLLNPLKTAMPDNKCYCFGHDFFDDNEAPYTVYSVKTDEIIYPENGE